MQFTGVSIDIRAVTHAQCPIFMSDFNQNINTLTDFIRIFFKICSAVLELQAFGQKNGEDDSKGQSVWMGTRQKTDRQQREVAETKTAQFL